MICRCSPSPSAAKPRSRHSRTLLRDALRALNPDEMTPREAMEALYRLKGMTTIAKPCSGCAAPPGLATNSVHVLMERSTCHGAQTLAEHRRARGARSERLARLVLDGAESSRAFPQAGQCRVGGDQGAGRRCQTGRPAAFRARARTQLYRLGEGPGAFEADLAATVKTIVDELAPASPSMAIDRLLRFAATHETVFERIDIRAEAIQEVYGAAVEAIGEWTPKLSEPEKDQLPERVTASLGGSSYRYFSLVGGRDRRTSREGYAETLGRRHRDAPESPCRGFRKGKGLDAASAPGRNRLHTAGHRASARGRGPSDRPGSMSRPPTAGHDSHCRTPARGGQAERGAGMDPQAGRYTIRYSGASDRCRRGRTARRVVAAAHAS